MRSAVFDTTPAISFGEKRFVASGYALGSPEQQAGDRTRERCSCGFAKRGPNHSSGSHHRGLKRPAR